MLLRDTVSAVGTVQAAGPLWTAMSPTERRMAFDGARSLSRNTRQGIANGIENANTRVRAMNRHAIEWHRKFFLALSCILLFFIGAPLGAIIRKGGLGMPTVLAIGIFLGIVSTLSMQHLLLSAIFASESLTDDIVSHLSNGNIRRLLESVMQDDQEHGDDVAFSVFSFFLFVLFHLLQKTLKVYGNSSVFANWGICSGYVLFQSSWNLVKCRICGWISGFTFCGGLCEWVVFQP